MKKCHNCGAIMNDDAEFCNNCNSKIHEQVSSLNGNNPNNNNYYNNLNNNNCYNNPNNNNYYSNLNNSNHNINSNGNSYHNNPNGNNHYNNNYYNNPNMPQKPKMRTSIKFLIIGVSLFILTMVGVTIGFFTCSFGHIWKDATCIEPKHCVICGEKEGNQLGHDFKFISCEEGYECARCETTYKKGQHTWKEATCTEAKTCEVCGKTEGNPLGHTWEEVTCSKPKTCSVCGETEGAVLGRHVEGEPIITEPTFSTKGKREVRCTVCNAVIKSEEIERKTPQPDGQAFNFSNSEFIDYLNYRLVNGHKVDTTPQTLNGIKAYGFRKDGVYDDAMLVLTENEINKTKGILIMGEGANATSYAATITALLAGLSDPTEVVSKLYSSTQFDINGVRVTMSKNSSTYMIIITTTQIGVN